MPRTDLCSSPELRDPRALPAKQARSEQTRNRLLQTGVALLTDGGFDAVSIAQIAAAANCSVGAFYQRFQNKQAYFEFLLDSLIERVRLETAHRLTEHSVAPLDLAQTVALCVRQQIHIVHAHAGLLRAALVYSINDHGDWQPIRDIGIWLKDHYLSLILPKVAPELQRTDEQLSAQLGVGLRVISGFLIEMITNKDTGPALLQPELERWLSHMVLSCLHTPRDLPPFRDQPPPAAAT